MQDLIDAERRKIYDECSKILQEEIDKEVLREIFMQNLNEGDSVAVNGEVGTVSKVYAFTAEVILEDGTRLVTHKDNIQPRTYLAEGN